MSDTKKPVSAGRYCLCLDTSGDDCQAGVVEGVDGGVSVLAQVSVRNRRAHSEKLMGLIDHVMGQADIQKDRLRAVAVSIGPGSFTGLRIGLAVAKGLGMGLGIPVIPVSTHDAYARPLMTLGKPVIVLTVFKKNEWFTTKYESGHKSQTLSMTAAQWCPLLEPAMMVVSDDADRVREHIPADLRESLFIPDTPCRGPGIGAIGQIAFEKYPDRHLFKIDELVPDYIQPFLGKM